MSYYQIAHLPRHLLILLLLLCLIADSTPIHAQEKDWHLVFSDEFNQPNGSQPDPTKWNRHQRNVSTWARWISNSERAVYIKKGCLVCRAIPNKYEPEDTAQMLTGAINTKNKFTFQYGKVEVRMKTNLQQGNFPAAWMVPLPQPNQPYAEIDIVETFGTKSEVSHTAHTQLTQQQAKHGEKNSFRVPIDITKWHVYSVEWNDQYIIWSIDNHTTGFYQKSHDLNKLSQGQWTFDIPFYIILNQSIGNGRTEDLRPQTNKKYETLFDWIRVYQKL